MPQATCIGNPADTTLNFNHLSSINQPSLIHTSATRPVENH